MRKIGLGFGVLFIAVLAACGDDAGSGKDDGGTGKDAGDKIPRLDGSIGDDPVPQCDRFDALSCGDGQVCNELIRELADGSAVIYAGCVAQEKVLKLGELCTPWATRYETEGLSDVVLLDPCGTGLLCAEDPEVRGASSCQPACATGQFGDAAFGCKSKSAFCFGPGPLEEICMESDGCDPAAQTGCAVGEACYLQINDTADGVLSVCIPPADPLVDDHAACTYVNDCHAGSSCLGPADKALTAWTASDFVCRPTCSGPNDGSDGGVDDGGVGCTCTEFSSEFLDFSQVPKAPYGQCQQ